MEEKLFNKNYLCLCAANFLFFFSFYLLLPVLPFFIMEKFQAGNAVIGTVISCYTLATLVVRPFSGYMMDTFKRKPLYLLALSIFTAVFVGYLFAATITILIIIRIVHGLAFGLTSVGGNTLVIDVVPSEHRGEGIGYFGVANNIAMAVGPMTGLFVYEHFSFNAIFMGCMACSLLAALFASRIQTRVRPPVKRPPISLDRFILIKGLLAGVSFTLLAFAYGQISNYIALYAKDMGLTISSGLFFTVYAVGLIVSRLFSGKMVDKGKVTQTIALGLTITVLALFGLGMCHHCNALGTNYTAVAFLLIALCCGLGFGLWRGFSSLQCLVHQPGYPCSAWHGHIHLPHHLGFGSRHRHLLRRYVGGAFLVLGSLLGGLGFGVGVTCLFCCRCDAALSKK